MPLPATCRRGVGPGGASRYGCARRIHESTTRPPLLRRVGRCGRGDRRCGRDVVAADGGRPDGVGAGPLVGALRSGDDRERAVVEAGLQRARSRRGRARRCAGADGARDRARNAGGFRGCRGGWRRASRGGRSARSGTQSVPNRSSWAPAGWDASSRRFSGSVSTAVVFHAKRPVLVVPHNEDNRPPDNPCRVADAQRARSKLALSGSSRSPDDGSLAGLGSPRAGGSVGQSRPSRTTTPTGLTEVEATRRLEARGEASAHGARAAPTPASSAPTR